MPILDPDAVGVFLRQPDFDAASATSAIRLAEGWLADATGIDPWPPDPVPEPIWSWALELAVMAYTDPLAMTTLSGEGDSALRLARREEILAAARRTYGTSGQPWGSGSFPPPARWPEPADCVSRVRVIEQ